MRDVLFFLGGIILCLIIILLPIPADAKVLPAIWDRTCKAITIGKYQHQNPKNPNVIKQTGHINPKIPETDSDILTCLYPALKEH